MKKPLILFYPNLPLLSENEMAVLDILIDAGKLIVPIYMEQEKQAEHQINRGEIERAAKKDPTVLSPYTVVEKINGKIIATPYHIKYAEMLKPIAQKLEQAAKITSNKEFGKALRLQAKALLDGSYDEATIAWLKIKPYTLDISIGPVNHFDDKLFNGKAVYQCWVGVVDKEGTERLNNYKETILIIKRKVLNNEERVDTQNKIRAQVDDVTLFSGFMARTKFIGVNLPMNLDIVGKYGAQVTLFNQVNDARMKEQILPTFKKMFAPSFREGFSIEDLRRASLRYVALHEIAHNYLYYKNAFENLKDYLPSLYELAATVLGLRVAGTLLLKDRITSKQLESMIIAYICRSYYLKEQTKKDTFMVNYVLAGVIFVNYLLESEALKEKNGLAIPNFMKIFVSLHDLSNILESLLANGTRKDAEAFIKKYGQLK